jgi:glycosyltransferase involved in cell wall biosynthesis
MVPVHDICGCETDRSAPLTEPSRVETAARTETTTGKVTFLIYSPFPKYSGGRENWLHNLAPHLIKRGHPVRVVSYATNRPPFYSTSQSGIESLALPTVRYFDKAFLVFNRLTLGLAWYLDLFVLYPLIAGAYLMWTRPAMLVCMNPMPEGLAAMLAGVPYVVSVRTDQALGLSGRYRFLERPLRWIERQILGRAGKVLANGHDTKDRLARVGIASTVVPNGVDFERFARPAAGDSMGDELESRAAARPVVAFVATMQAIKGAADAIEVAAELRKLEPDFVLAMVGKGDPSPFMRRVRQLGIERWVLFMGETGSVPAVLRRCRIFLGLSLEHGMSMSALEAMASGVAVVARDVPTYRQLIENERTGLLGSNPKEIASCCARLLRDSDLARRLGDAAQAAARSYDWPRIADAFLAEVGF